MGVYATFQLATQPFTHPNKALNPCPPQYSCPVRSSPLRCVQYLPSALRDSGKRQLDCLGIATAVLALCHHIAAKQQQHAHLAAAAMVVSDDHCWLSVPAEVLTAADASCDQEQQQLVYVEVTDPG